MNILYALGYELYPQNSSFFDKEFYGNEKFYKEFLLSKIESEHFDTYMFYRLNRTNFKRFLIPFAVLSHMDEVELETFISKQDSSLTVIQDYLTRNENSLYLEEVDNLPYKLSSKDEDRAFDVFYNLTDIKWGRKSAHVSIEKIFKSFFGNLSFAKGETNSYFRANYLAIYHMDAIKAYGNLSKCEWLSLYSAVINNHFFLEENIDVHFLLRSELINFCLNKGTQEEKFETDLKSFLTDFKSDSNTNNDEADSSAIINEQNKKIRTLENDLLLHKKEIELLNRQLNLAVKGCESPQVASSADNEENSSDEPPMPLKDFPEKVVYFGGHPNLHNKLNRIYPNWVCFDPDNYTGSNKISNADLIIYDSKYNNHGQQKRLKAIISPDIPVVKVREGTNEKLIIADALEKWNKL